MASCTTSTANKSQPTIGDYEQDVSVIYVEPPQPTLEKEPDPKPKKILVMGDSQACGMSSHIYKMAKKESLEVTQKCKVGSRISYWSSVHISSNFDAIILVLGSNDYEYPPKEQDIDEFLTEIKGRTNRCLWVGPPVIHKKESTLPAILRNSSIAHRCTYFDSREISLFQPDSVHTNFSGYKKWMNESIIPFLEVEKLD